MPDLDLQLRHVGWSDLPSSVLSGGLDVAFCREPIDVTGLRTTTVMTEPRVLVVRRDNALACRESVSITEASNQTFIAPGGITEAQRRWWLVDPRPDGSRPRTGAVAADLDEVLEQVAAGLGVAITGASVAEVTMRADLGFVPVHDIEPSRVVLVARAHSHDPVVVRFEQLAGQVADRVPRAG
jgi:DNA-binding transcriptional LysR family regulator